MEKPYQRYIPSIMKKSIVFILIVAVLSSCFCSKVTDQQVIKDTVEVTKTVIIRDTILKTDTARVAVTIPLKGIQNPFKPVIKQNKNARIVIQKVNETHFDTIREVLEIEAQCDSIELAAQIKDQLIKEQKEKVITETVVVYKTPKWVWWLLIVIILAILIRVIFKVTLF